MSLQFRQQISDEAERRDRDALKLFRAQPNQEPFFSSPARTRLSGGGNQSGKTTICAIETASAALRRPIYGIDGKKIPGFCWGKRDRPWPLLIWIIGLGEDHLADTIYDKLFKPGLFSIIRDPDTQRWRAWRGYEDEVDKHLAKERVPSPPLISKSDVEQWGWNKKTINLLEKVELKNGTVIRLFTSKGDVKQGDQCDLIWIDEDIQFPDYVVEWYARLTAHSGKLIWSSWPRISNPALLTMRDRAKEQEKEQDPLVVYFQYRFSDNPYMPPEEKAKTLADWAAYGEDVLRARDKGEFVTESVLMYPSYSREFHAVRPPEHPDVTLLELDLHKNGYMIPQDWALYLTMDPGHSYTAICFWAVPPPTDYDHIDHIILYDELYLRMKDADQVAKAVLAKVQGRSIQRMVIDRRFSRQSVAGLAKTFRQIYAEAFARQGIKCVSSGSNFEYGSDDVETGLMSVRELLTLETRTGQPRLKVIESNVPNWIREVRTYRKHVSKVDAEEKPAAGQRDHLMDCYDEKTEVLTSIGWRRFADISTDSQLATVNLGTDAIEYQQPTEVIRKQAPQDMIVIGGRKLNAMVTPHHRMVVYGRFSDTPEIKEAGDLSVWDRLKLKATWKGEHREYIAVPRMKLDGGRRVTQEKQLDPETFAEFLGWYVAEGSRTQSPQCPGRGYAVNLAQANPWGRALLRTLLDQLPWNWCENSKGFYFSDKQLWSYLECCGDHAPNKRIPDWIRWSEPKVIRRFLTGSILGDGWIEQHKPSHAAHRSYATTSYRLAGEIQELFIKLGTTASVRVGRTTDSPPSSIRGRVVPFRHDQYWVKEWTSPYGLLRDSRNRPNFSDQPTIDDSEVFCASVPNSTLIVRREGKPLICGNCTRYMAMAQFKYVPPPPPSQAPNSVYATFKTMWQGGESKEPQGVSVTCGPAS